MRARLYDRNSESRRLGLSERHPVKRSWLGLPVVDERDRRGRAFFRGNIHQESLAIGRLRRNKPWITDDLNSLLLKVRPSDAQVLASVITGNGPAQGLAFDGANIWATIPSVLPSSNSGPAMPCSLALFQSAHLPWVSRLTVRTCGSPIKARTRSHAAESGAS